MSESNKQVSRRFTELFSTRRRVPRRRALHRRGGVARPRCSDLHGVEAVKAFIAAYRAAFPDALSTVEDQVAEGAKVVTRRRDRGTHCGRSATCRRGAEVRRRRDHDRAVRRRPHRRHLCRPTRAGSFKPHMWARLREVKARYDGADLLPRNHHIPPAVAAQAA